eukprot:189412-Amphidinium_carterae.1
MGVVFCQIAHGAATQGSRVLRDLSFLDMRVYHGTWKQHKKQTSLNQIRSERSQTNPSRLKYWSHAEL